MMDLRALFSIYKCPNLQAADLKSTSFKLKALKAFANLSLGLIYCNIPWPPPKQHIVTLSLKRVDYCGFTVLDWFQRGVIILV
jgi:hypothetical protein